LLSREFEGGLKAPKRYLRSPRRALKGLKIVFFSVPSVKHLKKYEKGGFSGGLYKSLILTSGPDLGSIKVRVYALSRPLA
jgi:hypothetical protein